MPSSWPDAHSGLFQPVPLYRALRHEISPLLRTWPSVRVWHAGVDQGGEVYATAIVLREEGVLERATIWATDPDSARIATLRAREFSVSTVVHADADYQASGGRSSLEEYYTVTGERLAMRELLAARMVFFEHDAGRDGSFNEFQLIIHRSRASKPGFGSRARALELVDKSLCRFGILVLADGARLEPVNMRPRYENLLAGSPIWRKLA